MTRAYLYSLSFPNGIEFINTVLLFVSNHSKCENYFVCVDTYQNRLQESSTFKLMIEKCFVRPFPSRFCVTDITFCICMSYPSQTMSSPSPPSWFVISVTCKNCLDKCVILSNYTGWPPQKTEQSIF